MKYISHLDLMRLFQRSTRRAGIPVSLTRGFSPHLKISIERALKLGVESQSEAGCLYLENFMEPEVVKNKMNETLPDGIKILYVKYDCTDYPA